MVKTNKEIGMSQKQKLEQVLDLLLNEESDEAAELLHQIIVEKARTIYESIVDEEDEAEDDKELDESDDNVGGDPNKDFSDEIATDKEEIESDEENDGEPSDDGEFDEEDEEGEEGDDEDEEGDADVEDRVDELEDQLAELRAEFDALMGEEMEEPNHADLPDELENIEDEFGEHDPEMDSEMGTGEDFTVDSMFEKKKEDKLKKAPEAKDKKKDKKVDEETQFLKKVGDTGQKGTAKMVGTGKDTPTGAEQQKSVFSKAPNKPSYGGKADNILGSKSTGGEYGKWTGEHAEDKTLSDNVDVEPKKTADKADKTEGKFVGTGKGSQSGKTDVKSPLSKAPNKAAGSKKE